MKRQVWKWGAAALVAVWVFAGAGVWMARAQRMTATKVVRYMEAHRLKDLPAAQRSAVIEGMAERVNMLAFEERQKFRYEGRLREWFEAMTPDERLHYIDLTLPKGLKQMMEAFNEMPAAKRKQIVNHAMADLGRVQDEAGQPDAQRALSDANLKRMVDEGMKAFLLEANADTKLDLQPLIEQMQNIMQQSR